MRSSQLFEQGRREGGLPHGCVLVVDEAGMAETRRRARARRARVRPSRRRARLREADACERASTAFFMKQLGSVLARSFGSDRKGGDFDAFLSRLKRREMPPAAFRSSAVALAR